jgi:hypothetical protein
MYKILLAVAASLLVLAAPTRAQRVDEILREVRAQVAVPTATPSPLPVLPPEAQPAVSLEQVPASDPIPTCVPNTTRAEAPTNSLCMFHNTAVLFP